MRLLTHPPKCEPLSGSVQNSEKFRLVFEQIASECGIAARGIARTFGGGLGRSTVAHFASKVRGGEYCGGQALKIQQSHAPERWSCSLRVRGPHFASKVSYNAGAADLRRMFAQRLLLLCRTCYANLQMMVGLALENNPKSGKFHK